MRISDWSSDVCSSDLEFHGSVSGLEEQITLTQDITADCGAAGFVWSASPEERSRLWQARHNVYFAALQLRPGARSIVTDVCVPISRLADCVNETIDDLRRSGMIADRKSTRLNSSH